MSDSRLKLCYVPLSQLARKFLEGNPKKHDLGQIWASIQRHGFRDPLAHDEKLNAGKGGIVEGNGRLESLVAAYEGKQTAPKGIEVADNGDWLVPVLYGGDADSEYQAIAYAIDHNSLVMAGGDFTAIDVAGLYEEEAYTSILAELAEVDQLPEAVDAEDYEQLLKWADGGFLPQEEVGGSSRDRADTEAIALPHKCPNCGFEFSD